MNHANFEGDRLPSDPTQDQIRRRADAIRRRWSQNVTARRRVVAAPTWRPPLVMTVELVRELNARND
jgi:hypothetical protein